MTSDTWQVGGSEPSLKCQLPSSYGFKVMVFWKKIHKRSLIELIIE